MLFKDFVKETSIKESPESRWFQTLSTECLAKIKLIIFIADATWKFSNSVRYADYIAIENSFGVFRVPPLLNVIIHELTVNSFSFLPFASGTTPDGSGTDTHIPVNYTKAEWNKINKYGFNIIQQNQDFIDHIYQSHRAYASIALAIIISKINFL